MKFTNSATLLAVRDMQKAKDFYMGLLDMKVLMDLGGNVALDGGIALQDLESWCGLLLEQPQDSIAFGGHDFEIVLETNNIDAFMARLEGMPEVEQVHPLREYPWGQRVVRVYDPDGHIIEIGEEMVRVVKRFLDEGMTEAAVAERTMTPPAFIAHCKTVLAAEE